MVSRGNKAYREGLRESIMVDMLTIILIIAALAALIAAPRYGTDSRRYDGRPNW